MNEWWLREEDTLLYEHNIINSKYKKKNYQGKLGKKKLEVGKEN